MLKWCRPEAPSRPGSFLEHQVHALEGEEGKTLLRAIEHHREAYHANVKRERAIQVGHIKFRGWAAHGVFTPGLIKYVASAPIADKSFVISPTDCLSDSKSDSPERFLGSGVTPPTSRGSNRIHGQKNAL